MLYVTKPACPGCHRAESSGTGVNGVHCWTPRAHKAELCLPHGYVSRRHFRVWGCAGLARGYGSLDVGTYMYAYMRPTEASVIPPVSRSTFSASPPSSRSGNPNLLTAALTVFTLTLTPASYILCTNKHTHSGQNELAQPSLTVSGGVECCWTHEAYAALCVLLYIDARSCLSGTVCLCWSQPRLQVVPHAR